MKANAKNKQLHKLKKQFRRRIKLTLVPHGANQYRPHLIRSHGLVVIVLLVIGLQLGYNTLQGSNVLGATQLIATSDLLSATNQQRARYELPALQLDSKLSQAAFLKAQDMFRQQYWAHTAPDGTTPWHWFGTAGYNYDYAGENLAKNFASAGAVTTAWMASPEHRANILDTHYTQVGLAVVDGMLGGKQTTLVVALYGEPAAAAASVAGAKTEAPAPQPIGVMTRVEVALRSLTPAAVVAVVVMLVTSLVALMAHFYRKKMPRSLRMSWYRHHGAYKAAGFILLVIVVVGLYSGGQI